MQNQKKNQVWPLNNSVTWTAQHSWSPEIGGNSLRPAPASSSENLERNSRSCELSWEQPSLSYQPPVCSAALLLWQEPTLLYGTSLLLLGFPNENTAAQPHHYLYSYSVQSLIHSTYCHQWRIFIVVCPCVHKVQCNLHYSQTLTVSNMFLVPRTEYDYKNFFLSNYWIEEWMKEWMKEQLR